MHVEDTEFEIGTVGNVYATIEVEKTSIRGIGPAGRVRRLRGSNSGLRGSVGRVGGDNVRMKSSNVDGLRSAEDGLFKESGAERRG